MATKREELDLRQINIIEEWRVCKDFPNYEVSNLGKLKSKDMMIRGRGNTMHLKEGRILILSLGGRYLGAQLVTKHKHSTRMVHRLVAIAFIDNPKNKLFVNHIDGNIFNNIVTNLEWCTSSENMQHAMANNLNHHGETHYEAKLTQVQANLIREKYLNSQDVKSLASEFLVSDSIIYGILQHNTYKNY